MRIQGGGGAVCARRRKKTTMNLTGPFALGTTVGVTCQSGPGTSCPYSSSDQAGPYAWAASAGATCQVNNGCGSGGGNGGNGGYCNAACCYGTGGLLPDAGPDRAIAARPGYLGGAVIFGVVLLVCIRAA